jgi:hypothetical protein
MQARREHGPSAVYRLDHFGIDSETTTTVLQTCVDLKVAPAVRLRAVPRPVALGVELVYNHIAACA